MPAHWYIAPVCIEHAFAGNVHPGELGGCTDFIPGLVVHAYAYGADEEIPVTCLVGTDVDESSREGWIPLSLEQAKAHFEGVVGRPPSDSEVF